MAKSSAVSTERHPSQVGFSLIELLVTVLIIGVAASITTFSYLSVVRYQSLLSASTSMSEWLNSVKRHSMQNDVSCSISVSTNNKLLDAQQLDSLGASTNTACVDQFSLIKAASSVSLPDRIRFCYRNIDPLSGSLNCNSATTNSTTSLVFSRRGTVTDNAVFEFYSTDSMGGRSKLCIVVIKPLGIIRHGVVTSSYCKPFS